MVVVMHQAVVGAAAVAVGGRVGVGVGAGRWWLSFAAPNRTKDESATGQERPAQQ